MTATNIYERIIANIDADPKAWCKGDWTVTDDSGRPVSRCLVEHVDLAVGTGYLKPNGKVFVSKDPKRYRRRERVLAHLAGLLPKKVILNDLGFVAEGEPIDEYILFGRTPEEYARDREAALAEATSPTEIDDSRVAAIKRGYRRPYNSRVENTVVGFNDNSNTTKAKVRNLLKRAAKSHPED